MTHIDKITAGAAKWLDRELMPKLPSDGLKKAATVALATYALSRGKNALMSVTENSFLGTIGAADGNGNIDLEGFAEEMRKQMPESGLRVSVPMIGDLTFYRTDLDDLLRYIREV